MLDGMLIRNLSEKSWRFPFLLLFSIRLLVSTSDRFCLQCG